MVNRIIKLARWDVIIVSPVYLVMSSGFRLIGPLRRPCLISLRQRKKSSIVAHVSNFKTIAMIFRFPRLRYSLCGITLDAGTKFIGFLSLFGNLLGGLLRLLEWVLLKPSLRTFQSTFSQLGDPERNPALDSIQDSACIGTAILSFIVVICSCLLLGGAFNNIRFLMVPWLIFDTLLRCMHIVSFAYCILYADAYSGSWYNFWSSIAVFYAICIFVGIILGVYYWWIVMSFYLELQEKDMLVARQEANRTTSSELVVL